MRRFHAAFRCSVLLVVVGLASPAIAGDVASEFGLGAVPGFDDEADARLHCQGDGVVWADRKTGFFYPKFAPEYGASGTGTFTCYKAAKKADYWSLGGGGDAMAGSRQGRVFPFSPEPECDYKINKTTGKGFCAQPGA